MEQFPRRLNAGAKKTMTAALLILQEKTPAYPEQRPTSYIRQGTLGRTLGVSMSGQRIGEPEISEIRGIGTQTQARFGTRLEYAPHVIGDRTQAEVHRGHWWTMKTIATRARPKILRAFEALAKAMAKFLEGRGT